MDAQHIYNEIQKLPAMAGGIRQKTPAAISFLQGLYKTVTGNTVVAGCKGCHIKAANYLMSLTYQNLLTMSEQKFKLHKNVSIEYPFRSGQRLTAANITDTKAAEYLLNHPDGLKHFSEYPKGESGVDLEQYYPSAPAVEEAPEEEVTETQPKAKKKGAK